MPAEVLFSQTDGPDYFKAKFSEERGAYASDVEIKATCEFLTMINLVQMDLTNLVNMIDCYFPCSSSEAADVVLAHVFLFSAHI